MSGRDRLARLQRYLGEPVTAGDAVYREVADAAARKALTGLPALSLVREMSGGSNYLLIDPRYPDVGLAWASVSLGTAGTLRLFIEAAGASFSSAGSFTSTGGNNDYTDEAVYTTAGDTVTGWSGSDLAHNDVIIHVEDFPALVTVGLGNVRAASLTMPGSGQLTSLEFYGTGSYSDSTLNCDQWDLTGLESLTAQGQGLQAVNVDGLTDALKTLALGSNALSEESVDDILIKLAALGVTNCGITLNGGTSAPPSTAADDAITALEADGCTITVNEP